MSTIKLPTQADIEWLVSPVTSGSDQIGFAIGVASPQLDAPQLYFVGAMPNYLVERVKIGPDTYFELASNSKIFTTTLLAYYAQQNPDLLSAAVTAYTPQGMAPLPDSFSGITLQNLANYTSGLPADNETATDWPQYLPQPYTSASMYGFLHDGNVPVTGTGTAYTYSNLAVSLLADALPQAAGATQDFPDLLWENITNPLGMTRTAPFVNVSVTQLPLGIYDGQVQANGWPGLPAYLGGSGMVSTAHDMLIWLQFHMGMLTSSLNEILAPMQTFSTWDGTQVGLGWFLSSISAQDGGETVSLPVVWKDGGITGCSTFVSFLQSPAPGTTPSQAGVFVLTNDSLTSDGQQVAYNVLRFMNGYAWP
jgi:CubicO group peptidase (beta-lactamase class C family)